MREVTFEVFEPYEYVELFWEYVVDADIDDFMTEESSEDAVEALLTETLDNWLEMQLIYWKDCHEVVYNLLGDGETFREVSDGCITYDDTIMNLAWWCLYHCITENTCLTREQYLVEREKYCKRAEDTNDTKGSVCDK